MSSSSSKVTPPLETKVNMDNDYDYYVSKYSSQPPPPPPPGAPPKKETTYNLGVSPMERESVDGEEALMDLAQLEELHHEAERMKALGNKHMAAQVSFTFGSGKDDPGLANSDFSQYPLLRNILALTMLIQQPCNFLPWDPPRMSFFRIVLLPFFH